ncbi:MAG: CDP-glycerol glycerophosphotransferase family protein [bacterium]
MKHDTYSAFAVSDLMLSDVSSVIYEYLITRKPIIIVQNDFQQKHTMPVEMDIFQHVDIYDGKENIVHLIEQNLNNAPQKQQTYEKLLNNCFYSTRGNCVSQAVSFLNTLKGQLYEKISNDN